MKPVDRILVIDDDVELCSLVSEYLAPEGFQVESAADGTRGLEMALPLWLRLMGTLRTPLFNFRIVR